MADWRVLRNSKTGQVILPRARLCKSFWCHLKGLMFVVKLPADEGLLFITAGESRTNTAIHMLFMRIPISVIWLDKNGRVVDTALAKPWRPLYTPKAPAQYYLEANVAVLERVQVGDILNFDEPSLA
jgi:hypothetical protein